MLSCNPHIARHILHCHFHMSVVTCCTTCSASTYSLYTGLIFCNFYSAPVGVRSIVINLSVCLSTSISLELLDQSARNFVCRSLMAMAQSSSGGVALCCVLPVLWLTSHLVVVGCMSIHGLSVAKYSASHGPICQRRF